MHQSRVEKIYKLSHFFWYLFIFTIPFGTRLIIRPRIVDGVFIEWGTISVFASEIILLLYCFIVILLAFFDREKVKQKILAYRKILLILGVFLCITLISSLNSLFSKFSLFHCFRLFEAALLLASVIILRPKFKTTALVFSLSLIPSLILGMFQFSSQFSPANKWFGIAEHLPEVLGTSVIGGAASRFLRAYGTFAHPNIFAAFLVVNFWVLIYLISKISENIKKVGLYFLFFLNFYLLFLTFSRTAWLAFGVSLLVYLFICLLNKILHLHSSPLKKREDRREISSSFEKGGMRRILNLFLILLIFTSVLVYFYYDLISARFGADSYLETKSVSERMKGFGEAKEIIFKSPTKSPFSKGGLKGILFGIGPGVYTFALAQKFPELSPYALQPVHNVGLLILSEIGIFGLLAFIVFLVFLIQIPHLSSPFFKGERLRWGILLVVLFTLSLFDHYLWSLWQGLALLFLVFSFGFLDSRVEIKESIA